MKRQSRAIRRLAAFLRHVEALFYNRRSERSYLLGRCLRLEARLIEAEHERDDWMLIAQALGRGLE